MDLLYRGFDGLDVSFMGQITAEFCRALESAKDKAQHFHQTSPLNWNGIDMLVSESGARGGYAFLASTGKFGATWFFKKPNAHDPWGVRVSCGSFNLAVNGLGRARSELYRTLELLEITTGIGGESIGRVDYAMDFFAPDFILDPQQFVMHSNMNRADHLEHPEVMTHGRSGRVTSVTVGKMPGRQVIVYDKRAEVIARHKTGWWEIWNAARAEAALPPLEPEERAKSQVWRVELRAGKRHLKDRWSIRSWAELDNCFGDMIAATIQAVRYTDPTTDTNRSRWPNSLMWNQVESTAKEDLFEMRLLADPSRIKRVQREAFDKLLKTQMTGLLTTRAAICGVPADDLAAFAIAAGHEMSGEITRAPSRFEKKLTSALSRYAIE